MPWVRRLRIKDPSWLTRFASRGRTNAKIAFLSLAIAMSLLGSAAMGRQAERPLPSPFDKISAATGVKVETRADVLRLALTLTPAQLEQGLRSISRSDLSAGSRSLTPGERSTIRALFSRAQLASMRQVLKARSIPPRRPSIPPGPK